MRICLVLVLSVFSAVAAFGQGWQCRNDFEVQCASGNCDVKTDDDFTPMSVSFDSSGKMSVCAYTGCWEGTGQVSNNGNFMMLSGQSFKFSTSQDMTSDVAITFDKSDNIALVKAGSFAQPLICKASGQSADLPSFDNYKVTVSKAKPKPVSFRGNRDARMFRTRLRQANANGVNFAGHFVFSTWGCGTSCVMGAIINTKTGVVYFPEELGGMTFGYLGEDDTPLDYRKDSKLFILNGSVGGDGDYKLGKYYLVWEGTKFKQVKFVATEKPSN